MYCFPLDLLLHFLYLVLKKSEMILHKTCRNPVKYKHFLIHSYNLEDKLFKKSDSSLYIYTIRLFDSICVQISLSLNVSGRTNGANDVESTLRSCALSKTTFPLELKRKSGR